MDNNTQRPPIDEDAFKSRVLDNLLAGRRALDNMDDILGENRTREWQALSDLAIAGLEEFRQRERIVADALSKLIEENRAAIAERDNGE